MADRNDTLAALHLEPPYAIQQFGGGRRKSHTPPALETPTRLRPRRKAADDARKALGIRSKSRATGQDSLVPADAPSQRSEAAQIVNRQPSLAPTQDAAIALAMHHTGTIVAPNSFFPPKTPPLLPIRSPSIIPLPLPTIPHVPAHPLVPSVPSESAAPPVAEPPITLTGVAQVARGHPAPPAGPRKPSGSHPGPHPPSDHNSLPFTSQDTPNEELEVITIRPIIPRTCVIPPTPQHAGPLAATSGTPQDAGPLAATSGTPEPAHAGESAIQQAGVEESNPNHNIEADVPIISTPATPSGGRRSTETQAILDAAYTELDIILERVSSRVALSQQLVLDGWHKSRGRVINGVNHWNVYQGFFKAHEEQERQRIGISVEEPGM